MEDSSDPPSQPQLSPLEDYPKMIMTAIEALGEKNGSNKSAISRYIESNFSDLPASHSTVLSHTLNKMKQSGDLVFAKNNYLKPSLDAPPKRGRGRPPKPRDPSAPAPTPAVPSGRPRGRPPKLRDPAAPAATPAPSSGRPRGRPPKAEKSPETAAVSPVAGVKRGRGRPPKVRPAGPPPAAPVGA